MRLDDERESDNVQDDRGNGGGGFGFGGGGGGGFGGGGMLPLLFGFVFSRFGCGGVVVLGVIVLPSAGSAASAACSAAAARPRPPQIGQPAETVAPDTPAARDARCRDPGRRTPTSASSARSSPRPRTPGPSSSPPRPTSRYVDPKLVLYNGQDRPGGCGEVSSASGPFYCPADRKVYLDTSFFNELAQRFGAPGDFADAYVIAHEVGHHVQNLLGISDQAEAAMSRGSRAQRNAVSVRLELQADCFAGVWAHANPQLLDPGDVDEALKAATAIGDDRLQQAGAGHGQPRHLHPRHQRRARPLAPAGPDQRPHRRLRHVQGEHLTPFPLAGDGSRAAAGKRVPSAARRGSHEGHARARISLNIS